VEIVVPALILILFAVLLGPVLIKPVERNIEMFFLAVGALAAAVSGQLSWPLLRAAITEPVSLTLAVLVFGALTRLMRSTFDRWMENLLKVMPPHGIYFILIVVLGLLSSIITAVIAALILVEAISLLRLDRKSEIAAAVLACFAIGLGAALTPIGEPLGTIAVAALRTDFWYLVRLLGWLVVAGILIVGIVSLMFPVRRGESLKAEADDQSWTDVAVRAGKVYLFVAGLVGLSWGLRPMVDVFISQMPSAVLFWINSISAVVDNATLTAAEIGPSLTPAQQRAVLMGLLISGGMLIPGNIPNIVAAGRLDISSREWAQVGLVTGVPLMALCFAVLLWLG
jgi:predicted cation transporter